MYIKNNSFDDAEKAIKNSMVEASASQREEIKLMIKDFCKKQAELYEKQERRANAARIYEKLLEMKLSEGEKAEVKRKLMILYEKLGKLKEYFSLKRG